MSYVRNSSVVVTVALPSRFCFSQRLLLKLIFPLGFPKAEANIDEWRGGLQLSSGFVPVSSPIQPAMPNSSGTQLYKHDSQLELVHHSVETELQDRRQDLPPLRLAIETTIQSQLAGITAPLREEDESDSPSLDEESNADYSRWSLENLSKSSDSEEQELLSPDSDPDVEEMDYFGEAMYGMNNRDEGGFWSQYPGLD